MAFIGALIGGITNHLAIKMLFRPHEAKYIGSWRVPFTPGLIPKRRDELAATVWENGDELSSNTRYIQEEITNTGDAGKNRRFSSAKT